MLSSRAVSPPAALPISLLCIRDVRVLDPQRGTDAIVDLVIEGGQLAAIERGALAQSRFDGLPVRDGRGLLLLPGLIELHAQLGEPGLEYKEDVRSGLAAAAAGGFVSVCSSPDTKPVNDQRSITESLLAKSAALGGTELRPLSAATVQQAGNQLAEIGDQLDAGVVAISCGQHFIRDAAVMRRLLEYCRTFDTVLMQCPQDPSLSKGALMHEGAVSTRLGLRGWPSAAEEIALARDLTLCKLTQSRYHARCLSTRQATVQLARAKADGLRVSADVTPHHLLLLHDAVDGYDQRCRVEPPLREEEDRRALLDALNEGVIDCISCDHQPQTALETECEFELAEPGMTGLELCLSLIWRLVGDGQLAPMRAVEALTTGPARVLGWEAPSLAPGALASFTLFDPAPRWTPEPKSMRSKCHNSAFVGSELSGRVLMTAHRGKLVFESDKSGTAE